MAGDRFITHRFGNSKIFLSHFSLESVLHFFASHRQMLETEQTSCNTAINLTLQTRKSLSSLEIFDATCAVYFPVDYGKFCISKATNFPWKFIRVESNGKLINWDCIIKFLRQIHQQRLSTCLYIKWKVSLGSRTWETWRLTASTGDLIEPQRSLHCTNRSLNWVA